MKWRTPVTLAILLVLLLGAAAYGWHAVVSPVTPEARDAAPTISRPTTTQVCTDRRTYSAGAKVRAESFRVNVYNAGGISGQAGDVLGALQARGFREGVADNPPPGVTASNVSILTWAPNQPQVRLVAQQFRGPVKLVRGPNLGAGVDVVVGAEYAGIAADAPTVFTVTRKTTVCTTFATKRVSAP